MRKYSWVLLTFFCVNALAASPIQSDMSASVLQGIDRKVSIDLRDSELVDVLKFLAQKGKFNIFISPGTQGRVTLFLQDVRIADIMDIILLSNGLAHWEKDSIVYITTLDDYKARFGQEYGDVRKVQMIRLQYAAPSQVYKMLDPLRSKVGSIVVDEQSGTIVLMDIPEKMQFMLGVVKELDQPLETRVYDLDYAKAADVATTIKTKVDALTAAGIQADARSNQVIITALPNRMKEIDEIVTKLDRKTREVTIDCQIVKVDLSERYQKGVNWQDIYRRGILESLDVTTNLQNAAAGIATSNLELEFGRMQFDGFNVVFKFLNSLGDTRILASPSVTTVEGQEAKILIGSREVYSTTTTSTGTNGNTIADSIAFVDVGISMTLSAQINKDDYVTLKVKPEVSSVRETFSSPQGSLVPVVDTTNAETNVMVKDGTTIVMGGLRKEEKSDSSNQIPFLADLPVLGSLFKHRDRDVSQTEIVVFITPHIVQGDREMDGARPLPVKDTQDYTEPKEPEKNAQKKKS